MKGITVWNDKQVRLHCFLLGGGIRYVSFKWRKIDFKSLSHIIIKALIFHLFIHKYNHSRIWCKPEGSSNSTQMFPSEFISKSIFKHKSWKSLCNSSGILCCPKLVCILWEHFMFVHVKMPYSHLLSGHVMHPGMNNTACTAVSKLSHRWADQTEGLTLILSS